MIENNRNRKWLIIDLTATSAIGFLLVLQLIYIEFVTISSITLILVGVFFLTSNLLKDRSYVSRLSYWICLNVFKPKSQMNHLIWGAFITLVGLVTGIAFYGSPEHKLACDIFRDTEFWVALLIVVAVNSIIGLYTAKRRKGRRKTDTQTSAVE